MIKERYMVTGKRIDNGKMVKGYYVMLVGKKTMHFIYTGYAEFDCDEVFPDAHEVDPTTIESVTAKAEKEGDGYDRDGNIIYDTAYCPNCNREFEIEYDETDFCPDCGQRLDWEDV